MPVHFAIENAAKEIAKDALLLRPNFNEQLLYNLFPFLGEPLEYPGIRKVSTSFNFPYNSRAVDAEEIYKQIQDKLPGAIDEMLSVLNNYVRESRSTSEELRLYSKKPKWPEKSKFIFIAPKVGFEPSVYVTDSFITVELIASFNPG